MDKYNLLYGDPPWAYSVWSKKGVGRCAENHYPTMSNEDICALPIVDIAAKDSVLFLWSTYPNLPAAFDVVKAWGFKYKTVAFTWVKTCRKSPGYFVSLGHWTRANPEVCLLATKGNPHRISKSVRQLIVSPVRQHSQKPDEARERIVELMGDLPRIELFAREKAEGWASWGNEVDSDITLNSFSPAEPKGSS
jgi:N6-adenosine-specific RNA methylase IME4